MLMYTYVYLGHLDYYVHYSSYEHLLESHIRLANTIALVIALAACIHHPHPMHPALLPFTLCNCHVPMSFSIQKSMA